MSRFAVVYEDPEYEVPEGDWDDVYVEPGVIKNFDEWTPEAQERLLKDLNDPWKYVTV
jgi:hypothetical protein